MTEMIRLNKYLSARGIGSRRKCDQLIREGRVLVDNHVVTSLSTKIDANIHTISLKGKKIPSSEIGRYFLLNKPKGYLTTMDDPRGRPSITKFFPHIKERIFPVGRLDFQSQGLILLTNNGELTYRLTHPKYKIPKIYMAKIQGSISRSDCLKLKKGVHLDDGPAYAERIKIVKRTKTNTWISITITEGRNRIIRRMFDRLGFYVLKLNRIQFAFLRLDMLKPGECRTLTSEEIQRLLEMVNLNTVNLNNDQGSI
ncbi:MAG: pseudouridine synthase [bacterium]